MEWDSRFSGVLYLAGIGTAANTQLIVFVLIPQLVTHFKLFNFVLLTAALAHNSRFFLLLSYLLSVARWMVPHPSVMQILAYIRAMLEETTFDAILRVTEDVALPLRVIAQLLRARTVIINDRSRKWLWIPIAYGVICVIARVIVNPQFIPEIYHQISVFFILTVSGSLKVIATCADGFFIYTFLRIRRRCQPSTPSFSAKRTCKNRDAVFTQQPCTASLSRAIYRQLIIQALAEAVQMLHFISWAIMQLTDFKVHVPWLMEGVIGDLAFVWSLYSITSVNDQIARICGIERRRSSTRTVPRRSIRPQGSFCG